MRRLLLLGLMTLGLVRCGDEKSAADQCCPDLSGFDEARTYASDANDFLYFQANGSVLFAPSGESSNRGSYRVCGTRVWVDVTAGTQDIEECMLMADDGSFIGSQAVVYNRTN